MTAIRFFHANHKKNVVCSAKMDSRRLKKNEIGLYLNHVYELNFPVSIATIKVTIKVTNVENALSLHCPHSELTE